MKELKFVINEYIISNWLEKYKYPDGSYKYTEFAQAHYIEEKTARKLANDKNYAMTIATLEKICTSRDLTLEEFLRLIKR